MDMTTEMMAISAPITLLQLLRLDNPLTLPLLQVKWANLIIAIDTADERELKSLIRESYIQPKGVYCSLGDPVGK